jgi:hypothetical protein
MVDRSSWCVSYQYKAGGGTAYTADYARQKHLAMFNCIGDRMLLTARGGPPAVLRPRTGEGRRIRR